MKKKKAQKAKNNKKIIVSGNEEKATECIQVQDPADPQIALLNNTFFFNSVCRTKTSWQWPIARLATAMEKWSLICAAIRGETVVVRKL